MKSRITPEEHAAKSKEQQALYKEMPQMYERIEPERITIYEWEQKTAEQQKLYKKVSKKIHALNITDMKGRLLAQIAVLAAVGGMMSSGGGARPYELEDNAEPFKKPIPAGCSEYTFYGVTVVALNEKSALKKAARKAGVKC